MNEEVLPSEAPSKRFEWGRLLKAILRPRTTLAWVVAQERSVWITPLLVISIAALLQVLATGTIRRQMALSGEVALPPGFEYYAPSQQAQFYQAQAATTSPTFVYVLPAVAALAVAWIGWLYVGGGLHLALTLFGSRTTSASTLNLAAWAGLPYGVRSLVRAAFVFLAHRLIATPGLGGFAPTSGTTMATVAAVVLSLIDLYWIWHVALLIIGAAQVPGTKPSKVWIAVALTVVVGLLLQAGPGYLAARLSGMTVIRPFLF
ncbi:MAG TPA: YIP1 family protein [Anaerolineales bacterium]|nr:YIP1 family protein [Anaerolineales bacterium]